MYAFFSFKKSWDNYYCYRGSSNNTVSYIYSCFQFYVNLYHPLYSIRINKTKFELTGNKKATILTKCYFEPQKQKP